MNSILICGDPHGGFRHILEAAGRLNPMAVVLLGDMQAKRPLHEELAAIRDRVWWIPGNHDSDREEDWRHLVDSELADRNLHGRVVTLPDGTRLAGLGGIFRETVWHPKQGEPNFRTRKEHVKGAKELRHRSTIYPEDIDQLSQQQADILVTHEAGGSHPNGFEIIDTLAQCLGVQSAWHGHHHDRLDYSGYWNELGFRAYGVGLRGITDTDGNVIVVGERDEARALRQLTRWGNPGQS